MLHPYLTAAATRSRRLPRRLANLTLRALAVALSATMVFPVGAAAGDLQCVGGLLEAQAKLVKAWGKDACSCIEQADADPSFDADACVLADLEGRIQKAEEKLFAGALGGDKDKCEGMTPAVGYPGPTVASAAAQAQTLEIAHSIFGDLLDQKRANGDEAIAGCRALLCKQTQKLAVKSMKNWRLCIANAIKDGAATEADLVAACLGGPQVLDPKGKYAKAGDKMLAKMEKAQCSTETGLLRVPGNPRATAVEYAAIPLIVAVLLTNIVAIGQAAETTLEQLGDTVQKFPDQFDDGAVNNSHLVAVSADAMIANHLSADLSCENDGDGAFTCSQINPGGAASSAVALGKLNNDSLTDAVMTTISGHTRVCMQNIDGMGFTCSDNPVTDARGVAMADLDLDGDLDVVQAVANETARFCTNINGNLTCQTLDPTPSNARGVIIANLNAGVNPDVVIANVDQPSRVCLRTTMNNYSCSTLNSTTSGALSGAAGDVDGNGTVDVVLGTENGTFCSNDGNGALNCSYMTLDPFGSDGTAVGNLDGDKNAEVVFANSNATNRFCDFQNDGTFACRNVSAHVGDFRAVSIGDVDDDGTRDLVFSAIGPDLLCRNDGAANFTCETLEGSGSTSTGIALGVGLPTYLVVP